LADETTFAPLKNPDFPVKDKRAPKTYTVPMGDGYIERTAMGINTNAATLNLSWSNISEAEKDDIIDFFEPLLAVEAFLYQPPGFAAQKKWLATEWGSELTNADVWNVSATLQQVFDP